MGNPKMISAEENIVANQSDNSLVWVLEKVEDAIIPEEDGLSSTKFFN